MPCEPTPKSTPNRRRGPTGRNRGSYQKTYVSENDLPSYKHDDAAATPRTPQKPPVGAIAASATVPKPQSTKQKQKNKGNKNRNAKSGVASPGRRLDGESPPLQSQEAPARTFAGSSFHASPAPSALPLPRFLGLANADSPPVRVNPTEPALESSPSTDSDEVGPADDPIPRDESPLEFFFRADRAEKARVRRASSANADAITTAAFSPLRDSSHKECNTYPKTIAHTSLRRPLFTERNSSPAMSTNELGGSSILSVGPAFSTPYQERIRAARLAQDSARQSPQVNRSLDPNSSEALKRYLFTGHLGRPGPQELSPHSSPSSKTGRQLSPRQHQSSSRQQGAYQSPPNLAPGMFPASNLAGHAPRAQPTPRDDSNAESSPRPEHILALEGDLRRMLKIDSLG
ncbi:hypothetical protein FHL15_006614 [Xylaria flabelliformis]|uniref:Proteophosphoglycan 5 n=1 Tax=Xylaria flabelliformis TaxID=2512241 RepID=A0A553HWZ1_9PEZI|nr:hypothetical protein FHL15_006614 [Xylaria flabelliformis]